MDTYVYSSKTLNVRDIDRWLEHLIMKHLRRDLVGNLCWVYHHDKLMGKLTVEFVGSGVEVYTTSLDIVDKRVRSQFRPLPEQFLWNAFYLPKSKWCGEPVTEWRFLLASPRLTAEEIPVEVCKGKHAEIAAVKNTDWIWTGYNGGPVDLYKKVGGVMRKDRTIVLRRHS